MWLAGKVSTNLHQKFIKKLDHMEWCKEIQTCIVSQPFQSSICCCDLLCLLFLYFCSIVICVLWNSIAALITLWVIPYPICFALCQQPTQLHLHHRHNKAQVSAYIKRLCHIYSNLHPINCSVLFAFMLLGLQQLSDFLNFFVYISL